MKINWNEYLTTNRDVLGGKIHIKNTRIGVDIVLERLSVGDTIDQIIESYPHLSKQQILACIEYALQSVRNENIYEFA